MNLITREDFVANNENFVRVVSVLLEIPYLNHPLYDESLLKVICVTLSELPEEKRLFLSEWFSQYPSSDFSRILDKFQSFFASPYSSITKPSQGVKAVIRCMEILCEWCFAALVLCFLFFFSLKPGDLLLYRCCQRNGKRTPCPIFKFLPRGPLPKAELQERVQNVASVKGAG